jgi:hypothetical protein
MKVKHRVVLAGVVSAAVSGVPKDAMAQMCWDPSWGDYDCSPGTVGEERRETYQAAMEMYREGAEEVREGSSPEEDREWNEDVAEFEREANAEGTGGSRIC